MLELTLPRRAVGVALILALSGCTTGGGASDGGGGGGLDGTLPDAPPSGPGTLRVEPLDAEVTAMEGAPGVLDYRAIYVNDEGRDEDVTSEASFALGSPGLGSFSGNRFTSATDRGGRTTVIASARGRMATTTLTVRLRRNFIGPGASPDDPGRFEGADEPSRAPELVYPPDGIIVPPNLNELEVHYRASGADVFELSFVGATVDVRVYFTCMTLGAGCAYTPDDTVWRAIAEAERGQGAVRYRLRGTSRAGGGVGASAEHTIEFAEEDVVGGIYYWNAGAGAVRRYDFGLRGQRAENYIDAPRAGAMTCVGCHVVSRDGSRIAVGVDIPAPSPYRVYEVSSRRELNRDGSMFGGGGANFFTFSPDARQMMASNGLSIVLRDSDTGAVITDPLVERGTMPDWAPDGDRMVFARPGGTSPPCFPGFPCGVPGTDSASLELLVRSGGAWSPGATLVRFDGQNNYYPTFSPDGSWVLFNRSPSNANSFDAPDAQVWIVPADGSAPARHLATASSGGDSWPKWDPTIYRHRGGGLMWMTFASRRGYGLRLGTGERAQIWMTAFDPRRPGDGSYPAFWLPFQEIESGNHIAQWVTRVDRQPCRDNTECPGGEFCSGGVCIPDLI
ncbi:MAG: PD40 domain-containing protein [Sandaracinaceae bacterium]|nr:PD40 domain-containing protein [Sandaracinaceae bacterium]